MTFWVIALSLCYVYLGYSLLLALWPRTFLRRQALEVRSSAEPPVTLVIAAYNEEAVIRRKIKNSIELNYPKDKLEIIVFSDASSDRTDEIVKSYEGERFKLLRIAGRKGKTYCQNKAVEAARGEIVVFSDANSLYEPGAIRALVQGFVDPTVGCVSGELRYRSAESGVGGEGFYWRYEQLIKRLESRAATLVGANGAIYAVRRDAYIPLRSDAISDFVEPLLLASRGYRVVHERRAVAREETAGSVREEFRRRERIVSRAVHCILRYPGLKSLLNPLRNGMLSIQLLSHRVLRWLSGLLMLILLSLNVALAGEGILYMALLAAQILFYAASFLGMVLDLTGCRSIRPLHVPYYFCVSCLAMLMGVVKGAVGRAPVVWEHGRRS